MRSCFRKGSVGAFVIVIVVCAGAALAQVSTITQKPAETKAVGLAVGQKAPAFKARDQRGKEQTLSSLAGPKGLVLLFVRSADW